MTKYKYNYKDKGTVLAVMNESEEEYRKRKQKDQIIPYFKTLQAFMDLKGKKVLDFGCYHGLLTEMINKETAAKCKGIDIKLLNKKQKDCSTYDGKNIPFKDNTFDVVLLFEVVEHLEDIQQIFRELRRVLKPGGKIILTTPNKYFVSFKNDHQNWKNQLKQLFRTAGRECYTMYSYSGLTKLFKQHKFSYQFKGRFAKLPFVKRGFIFLLSKKGQKDL